MPLTAVGTRRRLSAGNTFLGGHVQSRLQSCRSSGFSPRKPRLAPLRPGTKKTSQRLIFRFPAQNFFLRTVRSGSKYKFRKGAVFTFLPPLSVLSCLPFPPVSASFLQLFSPELDRSHTFTSSYTLLIKPSRLSSWAFHIAPPSVLAQFGPLFLVSPRLFFRFRGLRSSRAETEPS